MSETMLLNMFPNEIQPCEGEVKVKAYNCAELQSKFFRTAKATGVLTITNKRVIFRTKGIDDKNFLHSELPIEDVAGITVKKGKFFDLIKFIVIYFFGSFIIYLPFMFVNSVASGISGIIAAIFKLNISQAETVTAAVGLSLYFGLIVTLVIIGRRNKKGFKEVGLQNKNIFRKILSLLNPFRTALTLKISSKGGEQGAINITVDKKFGFIDLSAEPVPTDEAIYMMKEVGAVINDIQKMGDMGIDKWQQRNQNI